jgi:hypothetical protein
MVGHHFQVFGGGAIQYSVAGFSGFFLREVKDVLPIGVLKVHGVHDGIGNVQYRVIAG